MPYTLHSSLEVDSDTITEVTLVYYEKYARPSQKIHNGTLMHKLDQYIP